MYGFGATIVLQLAKRLDNKGYYLYFDNYFSSYTLLRELISKNIYAACTVRINRFQNPPFLVDKKEERGHSQEICNKEEDVVLVKWKDNQSVVLASTFVEIDQKLLKNTITEWVESILSID